jgi:inner membrane protein
MDSLTQITLGAAMGEAVLGKKVGNRAMLWGAIGGTIPDLDVMANLVTDEITALAFHRGISHSLLFAVAAPFLFGYLVHRFYQSGYYRRKGYKIGITIIWLVAVIGIINLIPYAFTDTWNWSLFFVTFGGGLGLGWLFNRYYWSKEGREVDSHYRSWVWLFFWSIFTHPILDSCTPYGTQLFQPFWDYRVAWNNISVVDPVYTLPFLLCLIIAMIYTRNHSRRSLFNWLGIGLSTAYLLFTFYNKYRVNQVFTESLAKEQIQYERYMTTPTIFNNILWQGVAEGDTAYYHALYSLWDKKAEIESFTTLPKNHELLQGIEEERDVEILKWFSNGYYNVLDHPDGRLQFNDLRYGSINGEFKTSEDYIFRFFLREEDGRMVARQSREGSEPNQEDFRKFLERIKGR